MRWLTSMVLLWGCPGPDEVEPEPCEPSAVLGGEGAAFSRLAPGDPVVMVHGPQGGWHIEVGVRVTALEPPVDLHWSITDVVTGTRISESWLEVQPWGVPDDACAGDFTGMFGFLDVDDLADGDLDTPPELLAGAALEIGLEATDASGEHVSTEIEVTAEPDPGDL